MKNLEFVWLLSVEELQRNAKMKLNRELTPEELVHASKDICFALSDDLNIIIDVAIDSAIRDNATEKE